MARCPPGVICLESTVFILAGFVVLMLGYYVIQQSQLRAPVIEPVYALVDVKNSVSDERSLFHRTYSRARSRNAWYVCTADVA